MGSGVVRDENGGRGVNDPTVVISGVQCGRCGSSMAWESCDGCDGGYYEEEDDDGLYEPTFRICPACQGRGGSWRCLSDYGDPGGGATWCAGNPRPGRLDVPCSAVEEFECCWDGTSRIVRQSWVVADSGGSTC